MTIVFQRVETRGVAQLSYLIGDDSSGTAAVIDPRPNVDVYLEAAREYGVAITHIFETHIHADFMSGARTLADRLSLAQLCVSERDATYGFDATKIGGGDKFDFGSVTLTARHTPGHTPEHLAYEVAESDGGKPWAVLTGDSLFVGSAGRPDLLGEEQSEQLTEDLFRTLQNYYLKLDDGVILYPCHGAGSACGADIGDRPMSTIGYERQHNPFLEYDDLEQFKTFVIEGASPEPAHYRRLKKLNAAGAPVVGRAPTVPALPPKVFQKAIQRGDAQFVDTRQMLAFGGGHIPGAINIGSRPELSVWAGQMLEGDKPILLVVENDSELDWMVWLFVYTGFTRFAGYLVGGMKSWANEGLPIQRLPQVTVHELKDHLHQWQVLDVRSPDEWQGGHLPYARHAYVADLRSGAAAVDELDHEKPLAIYCDSGYRASLAASLLQAGGFHDVRNVPGSWQAWTAASYPIER